MGTKKISALCLLVLLVAATVLAYGNATMSAGVPALATGPSGANEPVVLLLWGGALLGVAGVVRRLYF